MPKPPIIVLVHPGSLCGSFLSYYDWSSSYRQCAIEQRANLCRQVVHFAGRAVAVMGVDLADEILSVTCVADAVARCERDHPLIKALPQASALQRAAGRIWSKLGGADAGSITVTGAWADAPDGCAFEVYSALLKLSKGTVPIHLSPWTATEAEIARDRLEWERSCA
jgi:hypothetical protein